jgi:hypothetical protein
LCKVAAKLSAKQKIRIKEMLARPLRKVSKRGGKKKTEISSRQALPV